MQELDTERLEIRDTERIRKWEMRELDERRREIEREWKNKRLR